MGWGACQQHLARSWNLLAGKNKRVLQQASQSLSLLGVFWYKALHIISGVWVELQEGGIALIFSLYLRKSLWREEVSFETASQHLSEGNHKSVPPRGAKMNTVPCRWKTQGPFYVHWCKIKDQVLRFSHGDGFPTAKLRYRLTKYRSSYSFLFSLYPEVTWPYHFPLGK